MRNETGEMMFPGYHIPEITSILRQYHNVFKDNLDPKTRMKVEPITIVQREGHNVRPIKMMTLRLVPQHWSLEADQLIKDLLKSKVIRRAQKPSDWCSPSKFYSTIIRQIEAYSGFLLP